MTSSDDLRTIHNSLTPPNAIALDGLNLPKGEAEEAYHFVVYLPINGKLYELDGLKREAVSHGDLNGDAKSIAWLMQAAETIQKRIAMYPGGSVRMAA